MAPVVTSHHVVIAKLEYLQPYNTVVMPQSYRMAWFCKASNKYCFSIYCFWS